MLVGERYNYYIYIYIRSIPPKPIHDRLSDFQSFLANVFEPNSVHPETAPQQNPRVLREGVAVLELWVDVVPRPVRVALGCCRGES